MAETVLAHIASSIAQKENLATEALAYILNRSATARVAMHRQVVALLGDTPTIARVATQAAVGDESRPDVILHADDGRPVGYIEAKFWAALTAAQPVEYVKRLTESGGGVLVMLAPERRLPTLRAEILERLKEHTLTDVAAASMRAGSVRIGVLSWTKLLAALSDAVGEDRGVASDVHQLAGLVARFEAEGFIPLTRVDIDDLDVPRRVLVLANLVPDIVEKAVAEKIFTLKGTKATHHLGATGRYAAFARAGCWIGLTHWAWSGHGRSPIWVRFGADKWGRGDTMRELLRAWAAADPPRAYLDDEDRAVRVPLLLRIGVEKDLVVLDVVRQLRELDEIMMAAGMTALSGEAPPEV